MINTKQPTSHQRALATDFLNAGARVANASQELLHAVLTCRYPSHSLADQVELEKVRKAFGFKNVMQVSRLLEEAIKRDLIQISVATQRDNLIEKLRECYPCITKQIHLVEPDSDHRVVAKSLGRKTAEVFDALCSERGQVKIGIGGGTTMGHFVRQMDTRSRAVTVTPTALLTRSEIGVVFDSPYLAMMAHWKCGELSKSYICSVPPLPEGDTENGGTKVKDYCRRFIAENESVKMVLERSANADVMFLGVAPLHEGSQIVSRAYKHFGIDHRYLEEHGAVADINYTVLDKEGNDLSPKIGKELGLEQFHDHCHPFLLAVSAKRIKELAQQTTIGKEIILVAGSDHKVAAMRAVLKGGLVNSLITDSDTARRLCER